MLEPAVPRAVVLRGHGLHSGSSVEVRLTRTDGPLVFRTPLGAATVRELSIVRADHGVRVRSDAIGLDVDGVEHLCAALGGLSIHEHVAIEIDGGELPLLDGAALEFANALRELGPAEAAPFLVVARADVVRVGDSLYEFTPGESVELDVEVDFDAPRIGVQRASWDGTAASFVRDVAWARTFGFRRDRDALNRAGRARGVDPRVVMVLGPDGAVEPPGLSARPGEFARHKLLDLVGDLYVFGGPPRGKISATRPGHAATHRAVLAALESGIIVSRN